MAYINYRRGFFKKTRLAVIHILLVVIFLSISPALYASDTQVLFSQGKSAFESGQYQKAVELFERAEREGLVSSALYFNLGSTYYKINRYADAENAFKKAAADKSFEAISYLNLGLVAIKQDDEKQAKQWLVKARTVAPNSNVSKLADTLLSRLNSSSKTANPESSTIALLKTSLGYEDRAVSLDALTPPVNTSTGYLEVFGYMKHLLNGTQRNGVAFTGNIFEKKNASSSSTDIGLLSLGVIRSTPIKSWRTDWNAEINNLYLGNNPYQQTLEFGARGRHILGNRKIDLRYRLAFISSLSNNYSYIDGTRQRARIESSEKIGETRVKLRYELEVNNRKDRQTATTFSSYSPTKHTFRVEGEKQVINDWTLIGKIEYRLSRYPDPNISATENTKRSDDRITTEVELRRDIDDNLKLSIAYEWANNNSNITLYDYKRNDIKLGLQWLW